MPDLAAYSTGYYTIQDGSSQVIGGTSAATPVVAGMISLINDALIDAGHSPLGFVNPFLYQVKPPRTLRTQESDEIRCTSVGPSTSPQPSPRSGTQACGVPSASTLAATPLQQAHTEC